MVIFRELSRVVSNYRIADIVQDRLYETVYETEIWKICIQSNIPNKVEYALQLTSLT